MLTNNKQISARLAELESEARGAGEGFLATLIGIAVLEAKRLENGNLPPTETRPDPQFEQVD